MAFRICTLLIVIGVLTPQFACAGGGAKIVIRQRGGHYGPAFGSGPFGQWLMNEGDMVIRNQLGIGNNNSTSADFPPAMRAPTPDPALASLLNRLDKLNGVAPTVTGTNPTFVTPPIDNNAPGVDKIPDPLKTQPKVVPE